MENGRYAVKRTLGEAVGAYADLLIDGHDHVGARLSGPDTPLAHCWI